MTTEEEAGRRAARLLPERLVQMGDDLEDFWGRRPPLRDLAEARLFGRPLQLRGDHPVFAESLSLALPAYSVGPETEAGVLRVDAIVRDGADPGPAPAGLSTSMSYGGAEGWISWQAGGWGRAYVDLESRQARIVIHPRMTQAPHLIRDSLLDTGMLNLLIGDGLGLLHACCLVIGARPLLIVGTHNAGKSTTALRLLQAGTCQLLTDSMVFVDTAGGQVCLHGFPVGRVKLRTDVLDSLGLNRQHLRDETVRGETKHVVDLEAHLPGSVHRTAVQTEGADLCILGRSATASSRVQPATGEEVSALLAMNTVYYDDVPRLEMNARALSPLLTRCRCFHLEIGSDPQGVVDAIQQSFC